MYYGDFFIVHNYINKTFYFIHYSGPEEEKDYWPGAMSEHKKRLPETQL